MPHPCGAATWKWPNSSPSADALGYYRTPCGLQDSSRRSRRRTPTKKAGRLVAARLVLLYWVRLPHEHRDGAADGLASRSVRGQGVHRVGDRRDRKVAVYRQGLRSKLATDQNHRRGVLRRPGEDYRVTRRGRGDRIGAERGDSDGAHVERRVGLDLAGRVGRREGIGGGGARADGGAIVGIEIAADARQDGDAGGARHLPAQLGRAARINGGRGYHEHYDLRNRAGRHRNDDRGGDGLAVAGGSRQRVGGGLRRRHRSAAVQSYRADAADGNRGGAVSGPTERRLLPRLNAPRAGFEADDLRIAGAYHGRTNGDRCGGRHIARRRNCRYGVSGGGSRRHRGGTGGGHVTHAIVDGDAGGSLHYPGQRRALAHRNRGRGRVEANHCCRGGSAARHPRSRRRGQAAGIGHRQLEDVRLARHGGERGLGRRRRSQRHRRAAELRPLVGDRVAVGIVGSRAVQRHGARDRANLVRTGVGHRGRVADAARQQFVTHARDIHRDGGLGLAVVLRVNVVAHLDADDDASGILYVDKALVQTGFRRERDVLIQRLDQSDAPAWRVAVAGGVTPQVREVAFHIGIAPGADEDVRADLVDDACVGLGERLRPQLYLVENRVVLEALGSKHARSEEHTS